jgi:hypothetical protein
MTAGRPTDYTPEIAADICAQIVEGNSLRSICIAENMPDKSTVFRWIAKHEEFRDQYAIAADARSDALVEDILDIADDGSNDWMERNEADNQGWLANGEHLQRSRLRVDTRKWIASKLKPKKYGEKVNLEATGKDGAPLNPPAVHIYIPDNGRDSKE